MAPLLGMPSCSPPRKTRSPLKKFKNGDGIMPSSSIGSPFKIGKKSESYGENNTKSSSRRTRWKRKMRKSLPSKFNISSHRSYDSFSSSRNNPSPFDASVMEYTYDFHDWDEGACFLPSLNDFKSLDVVDGTTTESMLMSSSTTSSSSECTPPPPPPPLPSMEPFFVPSFHLQRLDVAMEDCVNESTPKASKEVIKVPPVNKTSDELSREHVLSACDSMKFFEPVNSTSLTVSTDNSFKRQDVAGMNHKEDLDSYSQCSMPSVGSDAGTGWNEPDLITANSESVNQKEVSDSVIAWTLLGAVMGSPAPKSVLRAKKMTDGVNLWQDKAAKILDTIDDSVDEGVPLIASEEANTCDEVNIANDEVNHTHHSIPEPLQELNTTYQPPDQQTEYDDLSIPGISEDYLTAMEAPDTQNAEDAANSTLAWSALTMLLASPAPSCIVQRKEKNEPKNLWANDTQDESDEIVSLVASETDGHDDNCSLPHHGSELSLSGLDLTDSPEQLNNKNDTGSAIMWAALSALLASPAPSCVRSKKEQHNENLWANDCASLDDDIISLAQSETSQKDDVSVGDLSLSALQIDADVSQVNDSDAAAPRLKTGDVTNSTIMWGALTALLGFPAPSCVMQNDSRQVKNLWADGSSDEGDDLFSLPDSEADEDSVPSLLADSQFDSAPPSPLIHNALSFDSMPSPDRVNATMKSFIEWKM